VLVRSATGRLNGAPHTGMVAYDPAVPCIPAAAVSTLDAEWLSARLAAAPGLRLRLRLDCRTEGTVEAPIVIGQWDGTERPAEVIVLGAHLDAWDLGTGAHDDGAGCAQAIEALRILKALALQPKRSLRVVLYPDEEYGASAGRVYASSPGRRDERILAAMESDRGGFVPIGFGLGSEASFERLKLWEPLLRACGIQWVRTGGGGSDVGPLAEKGAVVMGFIPDSQRYFDYHHSANDVLSAVHPRELELGAVVQAVMAYVVAQEGI
jgi:carboxypeptidase Q